MCERRAAGKWLYPKFPCKKSTFASAAANACIDLARRLLCLIPYRLIPEIYRTLVSSMFLRRCLCPVLAVTCGLTLSATARERQLVIVVMPAPVFSPPIFHPQPPPLTPPDWTPPLSTEGPRVPPPRPQCYAIERVCALERRDMLGGTCVCSTANGSVIGRALIPPSHNFGPKS